MAAQHGAQASDEFIHRERLDEEIVRAGIQPFEAFGQRIARAGNDDGHVAVRGTQFFEEGVALTVGQPEIEHDGLEAVGGDPFLRVDKAAHPGRVVAGLTQRAGQCGAQRQIVFDKEDGVHAQESRRRE